MCLCYFINEHERVFFIWINTYKKIGDNMAQIVKAKKNNKYIDVNG